MIKWEYNEVVCTTRLGDVRLLEFGKIGWELVNVIKVQNFDYLYVFKRPIE